MHTFILITIIIIITDLILFANHSFICCTIKNCISFKFSDIAFLSSQKLYHYKLFDVNMITHLLKHFISPHSKCFISIPFAVLLMFNQLPKYCDCMLRFKCPVLLVVTLHECPSEDHHHFWSNKLCSKQQAVIYLTEEKILRDKSLMLASKLVHKLAV